MRQMLSVLSRFLLVFLLVFLLGLSSCSEESLPTEVLGERLDCRVVAVHSDYLSTSVSLLNGDGSLCADHVLHSGSEKPGLAAALSGDVVVASGLHPSGLVTLIDRFPSGTITWFDPDSLDVVGQLSVATGFAANPQDVVYVSDFRAFVSRAAVNPTPSARTADFDEGGDVLVINPTTKTIEGRIDLMEFTDTQEGTTLHPYPTSMVQVGGTVWVALGHQAPDFSLGGQGLLVGIDIRKEAVVHVVAVPGFKNCTTLEGTEDGLRLWGVCAGVFQEGAEAQLARSGVFTVDLTLAVPEVDWTIATSTFGDRPLGFGLSLLDNNRAIARSLGDFGSGAPDRLVLIDRATGEAEYIGIESGAYELGGILWNPESEHALVADANLADPAVLVVDPSAEVKLVGRVQANPSAGLPPRQLRFYR